MFKYLIILLSLNLQASEDPEVIKYFSEKWDLSKTDKEYLFNQKVLALSKVTSDKKEQEFKLKAAALHPKACFKALRVVSRLEKYKDWISFITSSTYEDNRRLFTLKADHTLLPYPMIIHILVDRPTKEGVYPFVFPTGMFTGLRGEFEIKTINGKCLLYAHSYWKGKKTKIPNLVVEIFSEALSKIGGNILMRKIN